MNILDVTLIILIFAAIFSILLPLIGKALSSSDEKIPLRYCLPDTPEEESHCDICEYLDGAAILFAVVLVVFITAYNDYKKEQKFRGLQESVEDNQVFTGKSERFLNSNSINSGTLPFSIFLRKKTGTQ